MERVWQQNCQVLVKCRQELYKRLQCSGSDSGTSPEGGDQDRVPLFAPDTDDHLAAIPSDFQGLLVFVGMGSGHGPQELLRARPGMRMLVVVEPVPEVFLAAMHTIDLRDFLADRRVHLFVGTLDEKDFEETVGRVASQEDIHVRRHVPSYQWRSEYQQIDRKVFLILNQCNTAGGTTRKNGEVFFRNRLVNFSSLRNSRQIGVLKDAFRDRPAVLVAAGPSLDRELETLRRLEGHCVLFAVDSAVVPLVSAGIVPDFVTALDYQLPNFEKVAPLCGQEWSFSLIASPKVTPLIPARLGYRQLFWAFEEDPAQQWVKEILGVTDLLPPGTSVAHLSLGAALLMGCDPIVFVGQDLAYTNVQADHAQGTVIMGAGPPADREIFRVPGVHGSVVSTDRLFLQLQKDFEEIIATNPRTYINASATGVRINGTVEMSLAQVAQCYGNGEVAVHALVNQVVTASPDFPVQAFVERGRKIGEHCKTLLQMVAESRRLGEKIARALVRLRKTSRDVGDFASLPGNVQGLMRNFDQINGLLDQLRDPVEHLMEVLYSALRDNDRRQEENSRLREKQGYLDWLSAEINRVGEVNRSRAEACQLCLDLLGSLCGFLEEENRLLERLSEMETVPDRLRLAKIYAAQGRYRAAEKQVAGVLQHPNVPVEAWLIAGEARAALLDFQGAYAAWEQVNGCEEQVALSRHDMQRMWVEVAACHARFDGASGDFPALLSVWLDRVAALWQEGNTHPEVVALWHTHRQRADEKVAAGEFDLVRRLVRSWQPLSARVPEIDLDLVDLAMKTGQTEVALAALDRLYEVRDFPAAKMLAYARLLLDCGRFVEGLARLKEAVVLDPAAALLWEEVGDALVAAGDYTGAISAFEQCYLALPEQLDVLCKMGDCYLAAGQPESSMAAYEAFLVQRPGEALVIHRLTQAQAMAARLAEQL